MKNKFVLAVIVVITAMVISYVVWVYMNRLDYLSKTVHETNRWTVLMDSKGDILAVETTNDEVWRTLKNLHQNQTAMWIGGVVEEYNNHWGFRFKPETIIAAQITIEGAQSNIQGISGDLDYWINIWGKETYVLARVVETHE